MRKRLRILLVLLAPPVVVLCLWFGHSAGVKAQINPDKNGCEIDNGASECSPAQLGANAITLPLSGSTALTNIIDFREVRDASLLWTCTQNATVVVTVYDEDRATIFTTYTLFTAAAGTGQLFLGTHTALNDGIVAAAANLSLPQAALAFNWHNSTSTAGTCTARLYRSYNK